jgi:hypothetical protein
MNKPKPFKPILLYDHLPGILAIYPAVLFTVLGILSIFRREVKSVGEDTLAKLKEFKNELPPEIADSLVQTTEPWFNAHMLFWIGLSIMVVWYIAFRFNLPKSKFLLMFGLLGTFVGIPVVLELSGYIRPFSWTSDLLGRLEPTMNTGAWFALSLVFFVIFTANFVYSRTHQRVRIDESGLTLNRLGGKGERFELIGLKTENEPLDYLELFLAGVGSLSLKTRMNKPIFTMKRVIGLYRIPWFPFFRGKLARIEEMLSYQGKVVSVERQEMVDAADQVDDDDYGDDAHVGGEGEYGGSDEEQGGDELR